MKKAGRSGSAGHDEAVDQSAVGTLRWSISLGRKFMQVAPGYTAAVVLATLLSQFSALLAFFLPLKVLILLGSTGVPRYFPQSFLEIDRDKLVVMLSMAAVISYLVHLASEKLVNYCSEGGAARLLKESQKFTLFEKQQEVASRGYHRYARSIARSVFVGVVAVVLFLIYPGVAFGAVAYTTVVAVALRLARGMGNTLQQMIAASFRPIIRTSAGIGFLILFAYMVNDSLVGKAPGFIFTILSLLLLRQAMGGIVGLVVDIKGLRDQRPKLDALFFHGKVYLKEQVREKELWRLLDRSAREGWVGRALRTAGVRSSSEVKTTWHQTGVPDVVAVEATDLSIGRPETGHYLVKLFSRKKSSLARHEADLLMDIGKKGCPALPLLGICEVGKFQCHVFGIDGCTRAVEGDVRKLAMDVGRQLVALELPRGLVERYLRSKPVLWQRLNVEMIERLGLGAEDGKSQATVEKLQRHFYDVLDVLRNMPLYVVNPDVNVDSLMCTSLGEPRVTYWGRWGLEPVGARWLTAEKDLERLELTVREAAGSRRALSGIREGEASLAALTYELEKYCLRQDFVRANNMLPRIISTLEMLDVC